MYNLILSTIPNFKYLKWRGFGSFHGEKNTLLFSSRLQYMRLQLIFRLQSFLFYDFAFFAAFPLYLKYLIDRRNDILVGFLNGFNVHDATFRFFRDIHRRFL